MYIYIYIYIYICIYIYIYIYISRTIARLVIIISYVIVLVQVLQTDKSLNLRQKSRNSSNQTKLQDCSASLKSKSFGGLHTLVIIEHSSGLVVSDMALYYTQHNHTKFGLDEVLAW